MPESFYEKAFSIVHEALVRASDNRGLDLFEADQTILSARYHVKERLLVGPSYKTSLFLATSALVSEKILDFRVRKHAFELGMWLDQEGELNDVVVFAVTNAIVEELDFLVEGWALRYPGEYYDVLYGIGRERQRDVVLGG